MTKAMWAQHRVSCDRILWAFCCGEYCGLFAVTGYVGFLLWRILWAFCCDRILWAQFLLFLRDTTAVWAFCWFKQKNIRDKIKIQ